MDPALLAFVVILTGLTAAIWLRLARIILLGDWPPMGLPPHRPPPPDHPL